MRLPDLILDSAVFLGVEKNGKVTMAATGFFLGIESELRQRTHGYLVTAKHCVENAKRHGPLLLRLNHTDGSGATTAELKDRWVYHDDEVNDVTVMPFAPPPSEYRFMVAERPSLATAKVLDEEHIGIGDDLAVVGLFTKRSGKEVNRPIVRGGWIAAMPDEPLEDEHSGTEYDAYLAEVRSIGGLSGSPVWTVISPGRRGRELFEWNRQHFYLLGLIRGHWEKEEEGLDDHFGEERESLNTGIAIVTPIQKALDILDSEEMVKERRKVDREEMARTIVDGDG